MMKQMKKQPAVKHWRRQESEELFADYWVFGISEARANKTCRISKVGAEVPCSHYKSPKK